MTDPAPNLAVLIGEHADKIAALYQAGFFSMKNGSVECFFDMTGRLRKIDKHISFQVVDAG